MIPQTKPLFLVDLDATEVMLVVGWTADRGPLVVPLTRHVTTTEPVQFVAEEGRRYQWAERRSDVTMLLRRLRAEIF